MSFMIATISYLLTRLGMPCWMRLFEGGGMMKENYCQVQIPTAGGIFFLFPLLFVLALVSLWEEQAMAFLVLLLLLALVGLLDDCLGDRHHSGFKGHFSALFYENKLTTGSLKALVGGLLALWIGFLAAETWWEVGLNGILLALCINFFNLLDLRPGRTAKTFLCCSFCLLLARKGSLFLAPFVGAILAYLPYDLKGKVMMGDTGSNLLGGGLGFVLVWWLDSGWKMWLAFFFLLVHCYTEKYSLTALIDRWKWLKYLDEFGRGESK